MATVAATAVIEGNGGKVGGQSAAAAVSDSVGERVALTSFRALRAAGGAGSKRYYLLDTTTWMEERTHHVHVDCVLRQTQCRILMKCVRADSFGIRR